MLKVLWLCLFKFASRIGVAEGGKCERSIWNEECQNKVALRVTALCMLSLCANVCVCVCVPIMSVLSRRSRVAHGKVAASSFSVLLDTPP